MATHIYSGSARPKEETLKIPKHLPDDLLVVYRRSRGEISPIPGWENQKFKDQSGIRHQVSWLVDRLGILESIDNQDESVITIYRGATVGNISFDDGGNYDPGPIVTPVQANLRLGDFTLQPGTPRLIPFESTGSFTNNTVLTFEMKSNGYFSRCPGGHLAVVSRCDTSRITSAVRGVGLIFGNVRGAADPTDTDYAPNNRAPSPQLESWLGGLSNVRAHYLLNGDVSAPILSDFTTYQVRLESFVSTDRTNQTLRYTINDGEDVVYDSGVIIDPNREYDHSLDGVALGHVFSNESTQWTVEFKNMNLERF